MGATRVTSGQGVRYPVARGWGWEGWGMTLTVGFFFWGGGNGYVPELHDGDGCTSLQIYEKPLYRIL